MTQEKSKKKDSSKPDEVSKEGSEEKTCRAGYPMKFHGYEPIYEETDDHQILDKVVKLTEDMVGDVSRTEIRRYFLDQ